MSVCQFCEKSLSRLDRIRFKSIHSDCEKKQLEILEKYKAKLYSNASNGNLSHNDTLNRIINDGKFSQEQKDEAGLEAYNRLKESIIDAGSITEEDRENLRAFQNFLGLDNLTADSTKLDYSRNLAYILEGNIPEINTDVRLQKGEVAHYESNSRWCHFKTRRKRVAGNRASSIRITRGVRIPVGKTQGYSKEWDELQTVDDGRVIVTSKRLLFVVVQ